MTIDARQMIRAARRLREATGYLELGLAQRALDCLAGLEALGPLEAEAALLRGAAMQQQQRFDEASRAFEQAAHCSPPPMDKAAWLALSFCYRQCGDVDRAIQTLGNARGALPPKLKPPLAE